MTWLEGQRNMKWARDNLFLEKGNEKIVNNFFAVIFEDDNEKKKQTTPPPPPPKKKGKNSV